MEELQPIMPILASDQDKLIGLNDPLVDRVQGTQKIYVHSEFWRDFQEFYQYGTFCDLVLLGGDNNGGIPCHRLVIASVSKVSCVSKKMD